MDEKSKVYVGMDVHKDTVMVAVLPEGAPEPTVVKRLPNELTRLKRWLARISRQGEIRACYEASGAGYVLERALREWGHRCEIVAPSLIPRRPGDRRKHDRKDATELARLYRAGELVTIRVPTEAEERLVFGEYLALFDYKLGRREELDGRIEALALEPTYREAVGRLCCLRGISTHAAMVLATEIGDFRRFESPGKLMAYVGLVPSEHSSGASRRQGAITKAGNSRVRHVLVQAAWSYRFPPRRGPALSRRQQGQAPEVVAHSWKAQHRLHKVFTRLAFRKNGKIAAVAVARELAGFVWAVMQDADQDVRASLNAA